jgi:integrase
MKSFKNDIFNHMVPYFKNQDLRDIKSNNLEKFYSDLPDSLSLAMRKHIFGVLHLMMKSALRRKDIAGIPLFPTIIVPAPQTCWIDEATQELILEQIPEAHKRIFIFMIKQGVRPGEARALHWEDVNFKQKTVDIHRTFAGSICRMCTKTKQNRVLPLDDSAFDMLRSGCENSGFVFIACKGGPYIEGTALNRIWNKAVKSAGLQHIKLYEGTRHSFLTQSANKGANSHQLQKFAGHKDSKTTDRYIHINVDALQMVLDKKNS